MRRRVSMSAAEFDILVRNCDCGETNEQLRTSLKRALKYVIENEITERQREMILMYYYENLNIPEIARRLEVNKSTVSRTLSRARYNIMTRLKWLTEYPKG